MQWTLISTKLHENQENRDRERDMALCVLERAERDHRRHRSWGGGGGGGGERRSDRSTERETGEIEKRGGGEVRVGGE